MNNIRMYLCCAAAGICAAVLLIQKNTDAKTSPQIQIQSRQSTAYQRSIKPVDFPADIAYFPGNNGKTSVEIYFGIPLNMIYWSQDLLTFNGSVQYSTVITDKNNVRVFSHKNTAVIQLQLIDIEHIYKDVYTVREQTDLIPGQYTAAIEINDPKARTRGTLQQEITVESFTGDSLRISDLLVAYIITIPEPQWRPTRETVRIFHHPAHMFAISSPIFVYFELVNLYVNPETRKSTYKIEYAINPLKKRDIKDINLNTFFKYIDWKPIESEQVWVTLEAESFVNFDKQLLRIENQFAQPGEYLLTVKVTDTFDGTTVQRLIPLWIFERKK